MKNFSDDYVCVCVKSCSRSAFVHLVLHFVSEQIRKCYRQYGVIQKESSKEILSSNSQPTLPTKDSSNERNTTFVSSFHF
jgi:hypothetical protein